MNADIIYHFTTVEQWEDAQDKGSYEPPSFQKEGFIHCCEKEQLDDVLRRHFKGQENLVRLVIDPSLLEAKLQYDVNEQLHQEFPHIYGPMNLSAVVEIVFLEPITSDKENIDNKRKD